LYRTTGLWLGLPTGRVNNSAIVSLQAVVARDANRVRHAPLLQRFVNLRLGEGSFGPKHHLFAPLLLPLDLGKQQFFPVAGTVDVPGPKLRRQTVALTIEPWSRFPPGATRQGSGPAGGLRAETGTVQRRWSELERWNRAPRAW